MFPDTEFDNKEKGDNNEIKEIMKITKSKIMTERTKMKKQKKRWKSWTFLDLRISKESIVLRGMMRMPNLVMVVIPLVILIRLTLHRVLC